MIQADHLFIDEIQKPRTDAQIDFFSSRLHEVIDARYDAQKPTLIAGNLSWADFNQAYPSVASRISQTCEVVDDDSVADFRTITVP